MEFGIWCFSTKVYIMQDLKLSENEKKFHVGYVAIVGSPNVGKSTLMNSMLDQKLAITTPKAQTTRHRILGILHGEDHQVIFLDTPGLIEPKYVLQEVMMKAARQTMHEADLMLVLIDAASPQSQDAAYIERLENVAVQKYLCVNKWIWWIRTGCCPL